MNGRIALWVPILFLVCVGLLFSLLSWYQVRAHRRSDDYLLIRQPDELILWGSLVLGAAMLGLFFIYVLVGINI